MMKILLPILAVLMTSFAAAEGGTGSAVPGVSLPAPPMAGTMSLECLHPDDRPLWDILETQCRLFDVPYVPAPPPDHWLKDEESLSIGEVEGVALHTPGHTPGSMCFHFPAAKVVLAGDTLFRGGIGRTDLWGGDFDAIERSIRERLYKLDGRTAVVTGHGPETEIGRERTMNSFVRA